VKCWSWSRESCRGRLLAAACCLLGAASSARAQAPPAAPAGPPPAVEVVAPVTAPVDAAAASRTPPAASPRSRLVVSLLTMSPGGTLFTAYGHTAIRIRSLEDPRYDVAYDYGSYDASDPSAPLKFVKGELPYWLSVGPTAEVVDWYSRVFGAITEQTLALEPLQAELLARSLLHNSRPELREYAYHHFRDNCATRPRDLLDRAFGGALRAATVDAPSGATFRQLIDRSMAFAPYLRWPTYGLLNGLIDLPISRWEQMFLPAFLREELDLLRIPAADGTTRPAVSARQVLFGPEAPARLPDPSPLPGVLVILLLLVVSTLPALLVGRSPRGARRLQGVWLACWGTLGGLYSLLILIAWSLSPYPETRSNGNLLVFHPLLFGLAFLGVAHALGKAWARRPLEGLLLLSLGGLLAAATIDLAELSPQQLLGFVLAGAAVVLPSYLSLRASRKRDLRSDRTPASRPETLPAPAPPP